VGDDECNEAQEGDDQTNIGEGLQDYTIHMRGRANKSLCEILQVQEIESIAQKSLTLYSVSSRWYINTQRQLDTQNLLKDRILYKEYTLSIEGGLALWATLSRIFYGTFLLTNRRPKL